MSGFIKKAAGWFAGFGLVMTALILVLSFVLQTQQFSKSLQSYINGLMPGRITYESFDFSLFRGSVTVSRMRLDDFSGRPLITADQAHLNLSWLSLIRKNVHIDTLILDAPHVYLETDIHGNINIVKAFGEYPAKKDEEISSTFELPVDVTFSQVEINNGMFHYKDIGAPKEQDEEIIIKNLSVKASHGNINRRSGRMMLALGPCDIRLEDMNSRVSSLAVECSLKKDLLTLYSLYLDSDMGRCDLKGTISDLWKGPRYDLDASLDADLSGIDRVFDVECELKGRVRGGGKIKGHWDDPEIQTVLHCDGGMVLGAVVGDLDLEATMKNRVIDIRRLFVKAPGGTGTIKGFVYFQKAFKEGFFTSDFIEPEFAYDLRADQAWTRPGRIPGIPAFMEGHVTSTWTLKGKGFFFESMKTESKLQATARGLNFFKGQVPADYRLETSLNMDHSKMSVNRFRLEDLKSSADLTGIYNTSNDLWKADVTIRSDDLSCSTFISPYGDFKGRMNMVSAWSGTWDRFSGKVRADGESLVWDGVHLGEASVEGFLKPSGVFSIERADLDHPMVTVHARGDVGLFDARQAMALDVTFNHIDAGYVLSEKKLNGVFDGRLYLHGKIDDPVGDLILQGRNLAFDRISLGRISGSARYSKGIVTVHDLVLTNRQSAVGLQGTARVFDVKTTSFFDDPVIDLAVSGQFLRIEDFYQPMKGLVSLSVQATGPVSKPKGFVELHGEALDLIRQSFNRLDCSALLKGEDIEVEKIRAEIKENDIIEGSGRLSVLNENYDFALTANGIPLNHINALGRQNLCEGRVSLELKGEGSFDEPELSGNVSIHDMKVNNESFENADLALDLSDGILTIDGKAMADIKGRMDIRSLDYSAKILFDDTPLTPFFHMAGIGNMGGEITGVVSASGNVKRLEDIKAQASVSDLLIKNDSMTIIQNNDLDVAYENSVFQMESAKIQLLDKGYIVLGGTGTHHGELDLYLNGNVPLTVVDLFSDELNGITGDVVVDGKISGTFTKPDIQAGLDIRAVSFMIPELMQSIHDVNGHVSVTSRAVIIDRLKGKLDTGQFSIGGRLNLDNYRPGALSLNISAESLPVTVPDMLDVTMNTRITVKGKPDDSLIEGDLVILGGKYYKDVSLDLVNVVKTKNRSDTPTVKRFNEPYLKSMGLNLRLTHKNPFEVDNNVAYLPLKPDLRVLGTLNNPKLSGRAEVDVDKSFISYQGKVFDVTKGRVDFINPYIIEPTLDVQCQTEIRDWIIYLLISGTPDNLKFSLTSNPVREDADILSLLVLGKTTDEILEGNGDKTQSAAKLLAGIVSSSIEKNIKDATGIDTVEVEYVSTTNTSNGTGSDSDETETDNTIENSVKVTLGKELSERLTLKYGVETKGGATIHQAVSEYRFLENLLMNAYQDTENKYGAELVYRIEFR